MSEVTYNEEVTAETLNNIAVDLGLAEFSYFENEKPYAVQQLNQITSDLVSAGVLRTGTNEELGCEVIEQDGVAYVQAGVIVFASGAKIRITDPVGIEIVPGNLIYAIYDSETGKASIETAEAEPTGDYVLLSYADEDGVLADRRSGCVANTVLAADTPNTYTEVSYSHTCASNADEFVIDTGVSGFSYIFINPGTCSYSTGTYGRYPVYQNAFYLEEGIENQGYIGPLKNDAEETIYLTKEGQYLNVRMVGGVKGGIYKFNLVVI